MNADPRRLRSVPAPEGTRPPVGSQIDTERREAGAALIAWLFVCALVSVSCMLWILFG